MKESDQSQTGNRKPRFYYGYIIVLVSVIVMMLTFGVNYTFGVFFKPLSEEFGWSKASISAAYSIRTFMAGFLGIFAGRLTDRFSAKVVSIVGGCLLGLGCIITSWINDIWQFYLIQGTIVAAGTGYCWPSLTATVPKWFVLRRGLMTSIVASGVGIGIVIVPPLISHLIPGHGWRTSYVILGTFTLVLIVIASLFMKRDPHQLGQPLYGEDKVKREKKPPAAKMLPFLEMIHSWHFWMVCVIYFCFGFCLHTVSVHIVPHTIETGIQPETAAGLLAVIGGTSVLSKLIVGTASDRIGVKPSLAFSFVLLIAAMLWLQLAHNLWMLYLFAFAFGFAYGGVMTLQSLLSAELFGLSSLGLVLGSVSFIYTIGSAAGPLLSGYLFDLSSSYKLAFLICAVTALLALLSVMRLTPPRKRRQAQ